MSANIFWRGLVALFLFFLPFFSVEGALRKSPYEQETSIALKETKDSLDAIRHEVENHETELRMFEERVNNQESSILALRQQVLDWNQAHKELLKGNASDIDTKLASIENALRILGAETAQLKTHSNEFSSILALYKQKFIDLDKQIEVQNKNVESLHSSLRALIEALQSTSPQSESVKTYKIKTGDSLEKIARAHGTTIKAIKELNNLANDKIIVGQTIKIP